MFGGLWRWLWGWGSPPVAEPLPGRVVCLDGYDRSVTSATGANGGSSHQGYDRSVTTIGNQDLDC